MKVNPKFRLRDPKAESTSIYLDVRYKGNRVTYGTGLIITPDLWDSSTMRATTDTKVIGKYKKDPKARLHCDRINSHLNKIYDVVTDYFLSVGEHPGIPEEIKTHIIREVAPKKAPKGKTTLNEYIDTFIDEIASGRRQSGKGANYADTTIKAYRSFRLRFSEFQTHKRKFYDFEDIDLDFYDKFTAYLSLNGNAPNSAGTKIKHLKSILQSALDLKLHNNRNFQNKYFKVLRTESDSIYLTELEISTIASLDLSKQPHLEVARDVFLIGCYTAQRVSDYSKIAKHNITKRPGFEVIELIQDKTGVRVIIPIKPELRTLLKKYNYTSPYILEQKLNKYIKEVGKLAKINDTVPVTKYKEGKKLTLNVPKYSLIQSHTARRTGATLMYLAGILLPDIMKITGHKTIKQLMQYIRITEEETATKLALHPYFRSLKKVNK